MGWRLQLSRWDDRDQVALKYTLLPFLIALIRSDKIDTSLALPLLRLCGNPVETWNYDLSDLGQAIEERKLFNQKEVFRELFEQFEENNPSLSLGSEVVKIYELSYKVLGKTDKLTKRLLDLKQRYLAKEDQKNDSSENNIIDKKNRKKIEKENKLKEEQVAKLVEDTEPTDELSLLSSIDTINKLNVEYSMIRQFLRDIRVKVNYTDRSKYLKQLSKLENLFFYRKLEELQECKKEWSKTSSAIESKFSGLDTTFYELFSDEFISHERLSKSSLEDIAELCNSSNVDFSLGLIKTFIESESSIPASVWLSFASILCSNSDEGIGHTALIRLLNSHSAKLAETVIDGKWKKGLYPSGNQNEIAANLVWYKLGSPLAADRWRAAHCVRRFSKLNRWDVISLLITKIKRDNVHPFQAPELVFYKFHARLWLLISLARLAIDYPSKVSKYIEAIKEIAFDDKFPHVLMQHFATDIISKCIQSDDSLLSVEEKSRLDFVNKSIFPFSKDKRKYGNIEARPDSIQESENEFSLDYDFNKHYVSSVGYLFNKFGWEMSDMITKWVRVFDDNINGMFDNGGREKNFGHQYSYMSSSYHTYGQQLGWHSLYLATGQLIRECPILEDSFDEDPWGDWLKGEILTRKDGLWLSDGIDLTPVDTTIKLLNNEGITGDAEIILSLIGMSSSEIIDQITVNGNWKSSDGISIRVSSALVKQTDTKDLVTNLAKESPFRAYLPSLQEDEYTRSKKEKFEAWLICPSTDAKLDKHDTLGASCAMDRPYFTKEIIQTLAIESTDPFNREWRDKSGKLLAHAEAWGYSGEHDHEDSESGLRLICSHALLKDLLDFKNMDLIIFIKLEKYVSGYQGKKSEFTHTTAVVNINKDMSFNFTLGKVNHLHHSSF